MPTYESVLVTAHGVVGEGEPQAHDGAREECHEHRLDGDRETLIKVFHERRYISTFSWWSISVLGLVTK